MVWGGGGWRQELLIGIKETFGGDAYGHYLNCDDGFKGVRMPKLIKWYILNMGGLLYASIKLF